MPDQTVAPREIARRGTEIYERKYRADYERKWRGRFVALDIDTERSYVAEFPEDALTMARAAAPNGVFFLVRIGSAGAFKASRLASEGPHAPSMKKSSTRSLARSLST